MKRILLLAALGLWLAHGASAQSYCASDGQAKPRRLIERFISADCESCWSAPPATPSAARALTLDWIVPSARGDEAPLSAAASRDALTRLEALGRSAPEATDTSRRTQTGRALALRVAHGVAINDYIAASIEMKPAAPGPWRAWLLLVESIPAGTEGSPIERLLVRNLLVVNWNQPEPRATAAPAVFRETRPMSIPPGARPERLRVVGWVEDARGRIRSIAQSQCTPSARP